MMFKNEKLHEFVPYSADSLGQDPIQPMTRPPIRTTLHDQLVLILKAAIKEGRWKSSMPSEAELSRELNISRMTLRKVMAQLAAESWIKLGGRGNFHQILKGPRKITVTSARTIRILTPFDITGWGASEHFMMEALSSKIEAEGYRVAVEHLPRGFKSHQPRKLAHLDALPDTAAWLLMYSTEQIQQWFVQRGRPTLLLGRAGKDQALSSIYPDTAAAARHAAGLLHSRGHRDMVYLIGSVTSIGDRICAEVFSAEAVRLGARARIIHYAAKAEPIRRMMVDLIASRPRPTAFVVGDSSVAITVLCHLQSAGIAVPGAANVLAMWDEHGLDATYPTIARYRTDGRILGRKAGDMLLHLIRNGSSVVQALPIIPEYIPGGSIS
jgi:DNA-binding LacI/PurR family transcriptional regulator